jgi:hypothetical protein
MSSQNQVTAPVGDLEPSLFPAALRPMILSMNTTVNEARTMMNRSQNSPQYFRNQATLVFTKARQTQALTGGIGRQLLSSLADYQALGVSFSQLRNYSGTFSADYPSEGKSK